MRIEYHDSKSGSALEVGLEGAGAIQKQGWV